VSSVLRIIEIAVALGLIIFVHELGHFLAAKLFGVRVRRFAIGMGPVIGLPGPDPKTGSWGYRPLLCWGRGETEYSLRWIPVGGFVDLAGEHPEAEGADDPRALWRRPAWQRVIVFAAGVGMNALLAIVFFSAAFMIGVKQFSPVVGEAVPGTPAALAGIEPGDRIVAVTKTEPRWFGPKTYAVRSFDDLIYPVSLASEGTEFRVDVERHVPGSAAPVFKSFTLRSIRPAGLPMPMLGIAPEKEPVLYEMAKGSPGDQAGLQLGDRILAVNGQPVETWRGLAKRVADLPAGPLTLQIERGTERQDLAIDPSHLKEYQPGFSAPVAVAEVVPDKPAAKADIRPGDRIARIEDIPWPTLEEVRSATQKVPPDGTVHLVLWRKGARVETTSGVVMQEEKGKARPVIGIAMTSALADPAQLGHVEPGGAADRAGLRAGDVLLGIGPKDAPVQSLMDVLVAAQHEPDEALSISFERNEAIRQVFYKMGSVPLEKFTLDGCDGSPAYIELPRIYNPLAATAEGLKRTWLWLRRVYGTISQIFSGQLSPKTLAGPVGIVTISYGMAKLGLGTLLNLFGMITVSVTVLNFLPVPPLDGGHILFVLIGKIKGSPVSMKVQSAIWIAGWVLVGALFVLVLFNDITREMQMP